MNLLKTIIDEAIGMFVDDGMLALLCAVLILVLSCAILFLGLPALWGSTLLLAGCIAILGWSVVRAAK